MKQQIYNTAPVSYTHLDVYKRQGLISTDGGNITILGKDRKDFTAKDKEELGVVLSDSGFSGYLKIKDLSLIHISSEIRYADGAYTRTQLRKVVRQRSAGNIYRP